MRLLVFFVFLIGPCLVSVAQEPGNREGVPEIKSIETLLEKKGLQQGESLIYDAKRDLFYISNGKKYQKGKDGFLSKISGTGELLELKWVEGLSRPTGMAIHNDLLYVADVDALKVIDIALAKVVKTYAEPVSNSGLNDVAITKDGTVFITASFIHSLMKLQDEKLSVWLEDENFLQWANGLFAEGDHLLVGGTKLIQVEIASKQIKELKTTPPIRDFDGIWKDGKGGYFMTTVENSTLWHIDESNKALRLLGSSDYFGDLQYVEEKSTLYVPRGNHSTRECYVTAIRSNPD